MSKRSHKALASATVMSLILTSTLTATNVQAAAEVTRTGGADRLTTAQEVAKQVFGKAETVVLVNGYGYADAVSATPLAKALNAPILLTNDAETPSADLVATLASLGAKKVVIVGGTGVVKDSLKDELAKTYTVERIAGSSRYETNANVAKEVLKLTKATKGVLVSAAGYADALSVASIAAAKGMPVLFGNAAEVPAAVKEAANGLELVAVGGTGVLPDAVLESVKATRVANGADRFDTNLKVLEYFKGDLKDVNNIFMAAGGRAGDKAFADALVASAAAAKYGAPVVLTGLGANQTQKDAAAKYVADNKKADTKVTVVGGVGSVDEDVFNAIKNIVTPVVTEFKIDSVNAESLTQIKVKFTKPVEKESATNLANYTLEKGSNAYALNTETVVGTLDYVEAISLQDDNQTVLITLKGSALHLDNQVKQKIVVNNVRTESKNQKITDSVNEFTALDLTAPEVETVTSKGLRGIEVKFSEDVKKSDVISSINYQLNGKSLSGYAAGTIKYDAEKHTAIIPFGVDLPEGNNTLTVSYNSNINDWAGLKLVETKKEFTVTNDTSIPAVDKAELVKIGNTKYVKVVLSKPLAQDAFVINGNRNETVVATGGSGTENTVVSIDGKFQNAKIDTDGNLLVTPNEDMKKPGTHVVRFVQSNLNDTDTTNDNYVVDAYGIKVPDNTTATYSIVADTTAPTLNDVKVKEANSLELTFSEDLDQNSAETKSNYTLKDSKGNIVSLSKVVLNPDSLGNNIVKLTSTDNLGAGTYTLIVTGIKDEAGNKITDVTKNVTTEDVVAPKYTEATWDATNRAIFVAFDEAMDVATLTDKANYSVAGKALPALATVTAMQDNKVAKIILPSDFVTKYSVGIGTQVQVANVKDAAGNKMESLAVSHGLNVVRSINLLQYATITEKAADTEYARLKDARTIEIMLDKQLSILDVSNFQVTKQATGEGAAKTLVPLAVSTFENKVTDDGVAYSVVTLKFNEDLVNGKDSTAKAATKLQLALDSNPDTFGSGANTSAKGTKSIDGQYFDTTLVGADLNLAGATADYQEGLVAAADLKDKVAPKIKDVTSAVGTDTIDVTVKLSEALTPNKNDFVLKSGTKTYTDGSDTHVAFAVSGSDVKITIDDLSKLDLSQPITITTKDPVVTKDADGNTLTVNTTGVKATALETSMTDTKATKIINALTVIDEASAKVAIGTNPIDSTFLTGTEKLGLVARLVPASGVTETKIVNIDRTSTGNVITFSNGAALNTGDKIEVKVVDLAGGYDSGWTTLLTK